MAFFAFVSGSAGVSNRLSGSASSSSPSGISMGYTLRRDTGAIAGASDAILAGFLAVRSCFISGSSYIAGSYSAWLLSRIFLIKSDTLELHAVMRHSANSASSSGNAPYTLNSFSSASDRSPPTAPPHSSALP